MKTYTDIRPTSQFEIERQVGNKFEVAFYDLSSVETLTREEQDGTTHTFYAVDKYLLTLVNTNIVEKDYAKLLQLAKNEEYSKLANAIRTKRDRLLADTDWTMCVDCQLSNAQKEKYRTYRQALRDVPEQAGFPYNVVFPTL